MRLRILESAQNDLTEQLAYLVKNASPRAAVALEERFIEVVEMLLTHPMMGSPRDELAPGIRSVPLDRRTLLFYRILSEGEERRILEIVRVPGSRQDLDALF